MPAAGHRALQTAPAPRALILDLALRPYELVAAWRPETRHLVVVVDGPVAVRQPVHARISVLGHPIGATIVGSAASATPHPLGFEVELQPDPLRAHTLEQLVEIVASGARPSYQPRSPRWLASLPAFVYRHRQARRTLTFSVSENGCGLAWSGALPPVGAAVQLHVGSGPDVASFCADVRWVSPPDRAPALGVELAAGDRRTWARILAAVQEGGAPTG